jgi:RES domain
MSPAGISVFYGSTDPLTAIQETQEAGGEAASLGYFTTTQEMFVLDLTNLPRCPTFYTPDLSNTNASLGFLHRFVADAIQPIERDESEHIEYVPTQIVTEFFRYVFTFRGGGDGQDENSIMGILYPSCRRRGGINCVLFLKPEDCEGVGDSPRESSLRCVFRKPSAVQNSKQLIRLKQLLRFRVFRKEFFSEQLGLHPAKA